MLIWADKNDVDIEVISIVQAIYNKRKELNNLKDLLKGWELSVIYRQIKRHFGERRDISILDFGAGVSPFGAFLNQSGYKLVTCLDKVRGRHRKINQETYNEIYGSSVEYIKLDVVTDYIETYDVIYSASVLEHIKGEWQRIDILRALSTHLAPGGLFIHVVDYDKGIDFEKMIDNCGVPIKYKTEDTPGHEDFKRPPDNAWFIDRESRIAFFNERED
jgi:2-polyprenyl-3-methyl-5-hydroxy-6-metoxy-1,4-benzoquinol methylase